MKTIVPTIAILAAAAFAQSPNEIGIAIGQSMKQNAENLLQYTYKRRTEIAVHGEVKNSHVDLVRFENGEMQTVPLSNPPQSPPRGGIMGRIAQKKKEETRDYVERLTSLSRRYLSPAGGDMRDLLQRATFSRSGQGAGAEARIVITGVVKPSDSLTMTWNVVTRKPVKTQVRTDLDGDPVEITVDYSLLPEGIAYPIHTMIQSARKQMWIAMDTFDYVHA